MDFGGAFLEDMVRLPADARNVKWEYMRTLRVDGIRNLGPFVVQCPNLTGLHLSSPGGFPKAKCDRIIRYLSTSSGAFI
jgi:hypothetical protein